jgi:hypothetical protein
MFKKLWEYIKTGLIALFITIPKSFFYAEGEFKPALFWITLFCTCAAIMTIQTTFGFGKVDYITLISIWGFILGWVGVYNLYKNSTNKIENLQLKQKLNFKRGKKK